MPVVTIVNRSRSTFTLDNPFGSIKNGDSKTAELTDKQYEDLHQPLQRLHTLGFIHYSLAEEVLAAASVVSKPAAKTVAKPAAVKPVVVDPVVSEPVVSEPVVSEPVVSEPVVSEPVVSEPVVSEPVVSEPGVSEPVVSEPVVSEPVVSEPVVVEPTSDAKPSKKRRG